MSVFILNCVLQFDNLVDKVSATLWHQVILLTKIMDFTITLCINSTFITMT